MVGRLIYRSGGDLQVQTPVTGKPMVGSATGLVPSTGPSFDATGTAAPFTFSAASLIATPSAGAFEYDGTCFYVTPYDANRAVLLAEHLLTLTANQTCTSSTVAQTWFPGGGATGISLPATTSYFFDGTLLLANGGTTHTTATLLALSGGLSLTSIAYWANMISGSANTPVASQTTYINRETSTVINSTSTATVAAVYVRGILRTNVAGTLSPQFQWSANPTGVNNVLANTWFRMRPVGSNTVLSVGKWS